MGSTTPPKFIENKLAYLCGNTVCLTNLQENKSFHIWDQSHGPVNFDICKTSLHFAFSQISKTSHPPSITIISYPSFQIQQQLNGSSLFPFKLLSFSRDGRFLATVTAAPESKLTLWDWNREGEPLLCNYELNREKQSLDVLVDEDPHIEDKDATLAQFKRDGTGALQSEQVTLDSFEESVQWTNVFFNPEDRYNLAVQSERFLYLFKATPHELTCLLRRYIFS